MDINYINIAVIIINILIGIVVYIIKQLYADLKLQLKEHAVEIARVKEEYVRRDDQRDFRDAIFARLDRMEQNWAMKLNAVSR